MTTTSKNNHNLPVFFGGLVNELLNDTLFNTKERIDSESMKGYPPANILETEKEYLIELLVPGYEKNNFKIEINKDLLTISVNFDQNQTEISNKYLKQEFKIKTFERVFKIGEKADTENISASYTNGILLVSLAKKQVTTVQTKSIEVK